VLRRPGGVEVSMWSALIAIWLCTAGATTSSADAVASILVYHRFGPVASDSMTVRTSTFRQQLEYLRAHGYTVVPLRAVVGFLRDGTPPLPARAVAITVDDGHRSVFTEMAPVVQEFDVPVTLFVYPSAISNASYALTWEQLHALHLTGKFDIQSHTYWHPNFHTEKRRLTTDGYREFVRLQFVKPREVLRQRLAVDAEQIAWPFGIYDEELIELARESGYVAGFTIERRLVRSSDTIMALPRFLVMDNTVGKLFASILPGGPP
jgi:peptidoglycan/xylan/chitin deacetylase (PgdA/CDA1 family)